MIKLILHGQVLQFDWLAFSQKREYVVNFYIMKLLNLTSHSGHQLYSGVPLPRVHVFNLRLFQARAAPVTPAKPVEMRPLAAAGNILPRNANGIRTHLTCELCGYEPTAKNK